MREPNDLIAPLAEHGMARPHAAPDLQADDFAPVLQALLVAAQADGQAANAAARAAPAARLASPTASAATAAGGASTAARGLRRRLLERVADSAALSRVLHTRRLADTVPTAVAPGVTLRSLYEAAPGRPRRPGEPEAVTLIALAPGAAWAPAGATEPGVQREWLVLQGQVQIGGVSLAAHDYHVVPAGVAGGSWSSKDGALIYQRQARPEVGAPAAAITQHAAAAAWEDFAPGIRRRVMWQQQGQAAMLYHTLPGTSVPHHGHHHDEECLMLAGDFFLDDVLLRALDFQLAPADSEHRIAHTDTGVVLYARGDVALDLR